MSGIRNVDLSNETQDSWPALVADVGKVRSIESAPRHSSEFSIRELVEQLVDERMASSDSEINELKKETRWMGVRVLTLEQTLKKSRDENKALSEYLQLCFDEIRSQDDRLSPRLAAVEAETLLLASRASQLDIDNLELRQETREVISKIDSLSYELFELIYDAKSVAVEARGSADAVAVQADELVLDLREAHEHVMKLEGRTSSISIELEDTIEAAELLVSGLADAAVASVQAQKLAEEARVDAADAAGLSGELRADLERRTAALRKEMSRKATSEELVALEEADRALEEALKNTSELTEEARVLAEKARDRAEYAADSSDELRADLDERTSALQDDIDGKSGSPHDPAAVRELRSEVAESLEALRSRVDERLNGYVVRNVEAAGDGKQRKRWHAHLHQDSENASGQKALPSET